MNKSDFYFDLPQELIAQTPIERREQSRLLCLDRYTGQTSHRRFFELPELLTENDCLVLNDSRVMPARLLGSRETGGAAEVVLLREIVPECPPQGGRSAAQSATKPDAKPNEEGSRRKGGATERSECPPQGGRSAAQSATTWECLVRPGRKIKTGAALVFGDGELTAVVTGVTDGGNRLIEFTYDSGESSRTASVDGGNRAGGADGFQIILERLGKMPLPPYIHEELEDGERYQTVYSRVQGSAAAPTAGLHFTTELLEQIKSRGASLCYVTLHVGLGTFRPVKTDVVERHKMHSEYFIVPSETAETVNRVKAKEGRIIAVGTTSCRALEACADESGRVSAFIGSTDIFIYPGYKFKCIDGLITNFHLPESTLIMLVSAFAGRENTLCAYAEAIRERYRFFSFGDAMLIT